MSGAEETVGVEVTSKEYLKTGIDLEVDGLRHPLCRAETTLGGAPSDLALADIEGVVARINVVRGELFLTPVDTDLVSRGFGELTPGQDFRVGPHLIRVVSSEPPAYLEGHTHPYRGRNWALGAQEVCVGRGDSRTNHVDLRHPTISRRHARLQWGPQGLELTSETTSSVTLVNGRKVEGDAPTLVQDGDLVAFGELLFRVRASGSQEAVAASGLRVYSLGSFEVLVGGQAIAENAWRSQHVRHVLAYLAAEWGRPVSVEVLTEAFWPDLPPERARRNLNWVLSMLRTLLRGFQEIDWIIRNAQTVQLNSEALDWHDLVELTSSLTRLRGSAPGPDADVDHLLRSLELYRGGYLDGCYLDWAIRRREQLDLEVLNAALGLATSLAEQGDWERSAQACRTAIRVDVTNQDAYLLAMRACREQGRPAEALRLLETCRKALKRELDTEPSLDLLREEQLARHDLI